jgi:hypothetical protein
MRSATVRLLAPQHNSRLGERGQGRDEQQANKARARDTCRQDRNGQGHHEARRPGRNCRRQPGQQCWCDSEQYHGPGQRGRVDADYGGDRQNLGSARKQKPRPPPRSARFCGLDCAPGAGRLTDRGHNALRGIRDSHVTS